MGCSTSSPAGHAGHADIKVLARSQHESNLQIDLREQVQRGTLAERSAGVVSADPEPLTLSDIVADVGDRATEKQQVEDAATPSWIPKERSHSDSGSDFNSWDYSDSDDDSQSNSRRPPKPASAKEHNDHVSKLDDFLAGVSTAPEGLKRRVKSRRSEDRLLRELRDQPQAEVQAAPQPGAWAPEDNSDDSLSQ
eukprot:TRINITY_DN96621_c0_g1_i1.p1 TRINITY_DN96621_c0_g1~~TRINITY_DN96621_c0_g1_i1.p1  ORF type:complete len:194 (-),score=30.13 TRINITY_DN96621_c0_g1_i1:95-676(-)